MLHDLADIMGSPMIATDGEMGIIRNFLLDDRSWAIQYVVVHVDTWHKRRDVVIPIEAVEQPDWAKHVFHARLTKEQVRDSPEIDSEKPVSRQQEIAVEEYWGKMAWAYTQMETRLQCQPEGNTPFAPRKIISLHQVAGLES